jgi:hypothetical protein
MNGKKARTIRKIFGVEHVRLIPYKARPWLVHVKREKQPKPF